MNCWEILGLTEDADLREIKKAYASLVQKYHPEEQPEMYQKIYGAYQAALLMKKRKQSGDIMLPYTAEQPEMPDRSEQPEMTEVELSDNRENIQEEFALFQEILNTCGDTEQVVAYFTSEAFYRNAKNISFLEMILDELCKMNFSIKNTKIWQTALQEIDSFQMADPDYVKVALAYDSGYREYQKKEYMRFSEKWKKSHAEKSNKTARKGQTEHHLTDLLDDVVQNRKNGEKGRYDIDFFQRMLQVIVAFFSD